MVSYTKPRQRKKEESERLRGERDQIKFIDLRFEKQYHCYVDVVMSIYQLLTVTLGGK